MQLLRGMDADDGWLPNEIKIDGLAEFAGKRHYSLATLAPNRTRKDRDATPFFLVEVTGRRKVSELSEVGTDGAS